jgi:NAD(P)-dependent dehydrogenase (short-subunit alcohol dehydrogenase family)
MNRVALVTGAAGGIGAATVRALSADGWQVFAVDRRTVKESGDGVISWAADVSRESDAVGVFERLGKAAGRLDALINNAAIQICKPLLEMSVEEWDSTMESNLRSVFLSAKAGFPWLKAAAGCIVNVGSVHALATSVDIAAYAASKGGLAALTRAMALEFGPAGIRVNAILPGAVDTPMLKEGLERSGTEPAARQRLEGRTPLGRIARPEEIAQAILFLASAERSSFISGECLVADGGALARLSTE